MKCRSASSRENPNVVCVRSLVPKEKNSASDAISPAVSAARGISIIVPNLYGTATPFSFCTSSATGLSSACTSRSSASVPTSGIMISGRASIPRLRRSQAASMIARTCMRGISGKRTDRRTPRSPSIGFASCRSSTRASMRSSLCSLAGCLCVARKTAVWATSSSRLGRNSCRGGSMSRITTGLPAITLRMPRKSPRWIGSRRASCFSRAGVVPAMIMALTIGRRSDSMNMCSVRHRPTPCAPFSSALRASRG